MTEKDIVMAVFFGFIFVGILGCLIATVFATIIENRQRREAKSHQPAPTPNDTAYNNAIIAALVTERLELQRQNAELCEQVSALTVQLEAAREARGDRQGPRCGVPGCDAPMYRWGPGDGGIWYRCEKHFKEEIADGA